MKNYIIIGIVFVIIIGTYFIYQSSQSEQSINKEGTEVIMELQASCQTDADCKEYISHNTCELFCANNSEVNNTIISGLKISCDSTLWDPPLD
jgi:hypothetical protein